MPKKWKIGFVIAFVLVLAYLIVALSFTTQKEQELLCCKLNVTVTDSVDMQFVNSADVRRLLASGGRKITGEKLNNLNLYELQQVLYKQSQIKSADVYTSVDGSLNVKVKQREPIIRVQTGQRGFYVDETGYVFNLSKSYTSYVVVATGNIPVSFSNSFTGPIPSDNGSKFMQKLYEFALFLRNDEFWSSMIEQINVNSAADVELIPRVGSHVVKLGEIDGYEAKLAKLLLFYRKALPEEGWNTYRTINLRYNNQIVCTKK